MKRPVRGVLAVVVLLAAGCSGDDDADDTTVPTDPVTVAPHTTFAATTDPAAPSTPPSTTAIPTAPTTPPLSELDALKATIAADYVESYRARREITLNPTLDDLDARAATIAAAGSPDYNGLVALVQELVARGERVIPGDPPIDETNVELVEIADPSATSATVTSCLVFNWARVGADGIPIGDTGVLTAARTTQDVELTDEGWLPSSIIGVIEADEGVMTCPVS